jgi:hypothetical protein
MSVLTSRVLWGKDLFMIGLLDSEKNSCYLTVLVLVGDSILKEGGQAPCITMVVCYCQQDVTYMHRFAEQKRSRGTDHQP